MKKKLLLLSVIFCLGISTQADADCQHQWGEWEIKEATCGEDGYKVRWCDECYEDEEIVLPATGNHVWGEWTVEEEPDCGYAGSEVRECKNCWETQERTIPATGIHNWSDWEIENPTCNEPGYKWRQCENCDKEEEITLKATGKHVWGKWVIARKATCLKNGKKIRYCKVCGEAYQTAVIKAAGKHAWGKWKTTQKATILTTGKKIRTCKTCSKQQSESIPKIKATKNEKQLLSSVSAFFSYAKTYDTTKIKNCFQSPEKVSLFITKKYTAKFIRSCNKNLKYSIKSVSVKGSSATVKVQCRFVNAYNIHLNSINDLTNYIYSHPGKSSDYLDKVQYKRELKWYKDFGKEYSTETLTLNYIKVNGKWKIKKFTNSLKNVIHGNYQKAYDEYFWNF